MRNITRTEFDAYTAHLAEINGVPSAIRSFTVSPTVEQTLTDRIQESADFLRLINMPLVDQQSAEILGMGTSGPVAGRTDTTTKDREPRSVIDMQGRSYTCKQTNFDTFITYSQLDAWAKFKDFQARMRNHVTLQVARDRLMVGFNGISAAADTDPATNTLLQDLNKGWLQHVREDASERVLTGIKVGTEDGADYRNLDAAVFDAVNELLEPWYREDPEIVVIVGRSLLTDKYLGLINSTDADAPTEKAALSTLILNKSLGGKVAQAVPFFPSRSMLITKPSNLSIYTQSGTVRRYIQDEPKRDRIVDYLSMNEDYVVEDLSACALIEGILLPDGAGGWN